MFNLRTRIIVAVGMFLISTMLLALPPNSVGTNRNAAAAPIDWSAVDQAIGRAGAMQPGNVYRYAIPRSDMQVTVGGIAVKPAFALGSHVEMLPIGDNDVMFMGDLVLAEGEVSPVLSALQGGGIDLAALHNHLLGESPRVMYLHIGGHGDPIQLATTIHAALMQSGTPLTAPPAATPAADTGLDTQRLDQLIGFAGKANGGVYQFSIPRAEKIMDSGMAMGGTDAMTQGGVELPPAIGVATAINFQATGDGKAIITGDFVLTADEVASVARTLRGDGIDVTAVHSHGLTESPRLFYMHFFAHDDPVTLATALRAAIDQTNSAQPAV